MQTIPWGDREIGERRWVRRSRCVLATFATATVMGSVPIAMPIAIPAATARAETTALVLGGTAQPTPSQWDMENALDGILADCTLVPVTTPAQWWPLVGTVPWDESVAEGGQSLMDAIAATDGPIIVFGYSQGAYIANQVAQQLSVAGDAPSRDELTFIVTANIGRPGGLLTVLPNGWSILGTTFTGGVQPATPYDFIDVAYEYDGIARWPTYRGNVIADLNAVMGALYVHGAYSKVDLDDVPAEDITSATNSAGGTTTYYTVRQPDLPILQPLRDIGVHEAIVDALNDALTPVVKAAYAPEPEVQSPVPDAAAAATAPTTATNVTVAAPPSTGDQVERPETAVTKAPPKKKNRNADEDEKPTQAAEPDDQEAEAKPGEPVTRKRPVAESGAKSSAPSPRSASGVSESADAPKSSDAPEGSSGA